MEYSVIIRGGREWTITEMDPEAQIEFECRVLHLLGPGLAAGLGSLSGDLVKQLIGIIDEIAHAGDDDGFDLTRIARAWRTIDSTDPRVKAAWAAFVVAVPAFAGQAISSAVPELTDRIADPKMVMRLFELAVVGRVLADTGSGNLARLNDYKTLRKLGAAVKWQLLFAAARHNYPEIYGPPPRGPEPEVETVIDIEAE